VDLPIRVNCHDIIDEVRKLSPAAPMVPSGNDLPAGDLNGRKQGRGVVPLALLTESVGSPAPARVD